jgi:murein DD-endopeptidase MepM/ murein hydrolase activator NlpD
MIRTLLLLGILLCAFAGAKDIDAKIAQTTKSLKHFDRNYASINAKMAKTAKSILEKEHAVLKQRKRIDALEQELKAKGKTLTSSRKTLQSLTEEQEALNARQKQLRDDISELMARLVSLAMMQDDNNTLSPDAIMSEEIFKSLGAHTREQMKRMETEFRTNKKQLRTLTGKTAKLKNDIRSIERKKKALEEEKRANETALKALRKKKAKYKQQIKTLLAQKNELKKTLESLKIIQESETQKARANAERKRNEALLASKPLPKVKSVGSSYHKARTRRYRGKKTIAPLDRYTVLKRYGTYTDPIYKIKIFNESVSLKPKSPNAKVKAVFNGKVILAQKTPLLENVVIIEHANGLHTIYAHLDRIAPTIKKGKRLKKGSVIGRVNDELMFEVTQKNYHIDPLKVIQ